MRVRYLLLPLIALALALPQAGTAVAMSSPPAYPQSSPYETIVAVADTSADTRSKAFAIALVRVLSRKMGQPLVASQAAQVASKAASLVRQYSYQSAAAGSSSPYDLLVQFAPDAIRQLASSLIDVNSLDEMHEPGMATPAEVAGLGDAVWISGIGSALDFAGALHALRHASGIERVELRQARGDGMLVRVYASVPWASVAAQVEGGGQFVPGPASAGSVGGLRWVP